MKWTEYFIWENSFTLFSVFSRLLKYHEKNKKKTIDSFRKTYAYHFTTFHA